MRARAIVIGASIGGLLAARALADAYREVVVVEKDPATSAQSARKGVPQGEHIHLLWSGGLDIIEDWFPGITAELLDRGATAIDNGSEMRWYHHGVWKIRQPSDLTILSQSRPLLEEVILQRTLAHGGISIRHGRRVLRLLTDDGARRITGAELAGGDGSRENLKADLVVDASGRSGAGLQSLEALGFGRPREERIGVDIGYATQVFEQPDEPARDWKNMAIYARAPETYRLGVIFPIEGQRWIVTLAGLRGRYLRESDNAAFLEYARGLDQPDLADALANAVPAGPVRHIRYREQLRRHFDDMPDFPSGYLPFGDMVCSLNPMYGQGITVCARESQVLAACLRRAGSRAPDRSLTRAWFRGIAATVNSAWLLGSANDFLYPETTGKRPPLIGALGWYVTRVLALSGSSPLVMRRFLEVVHFKRPITALLTPGVIGRVMFSTGSRR